MQETPVQFLGREDGWRRDRLPTPVFLGFPCGSTGKESACIVGGLGSIPGLGRALGEGKGYLLQYSGLENPMDCTVHGVKKSWTRLSHFHFQHSIELCTTPRIFSGGSDGKASVYNAGDLGSIPESGRSLGEGNGYPLQNSGLENPMDCTVQEVTKSQT